MNTEKLHIEPPLVTPEIYQVIAQYAEAHTQAKLVVIYVPEVSATITGTAHDGEIQSWSVCSPTTEDAARAFFADQVQRGDLDEDAVVFLHMDELTIN